MSVYILSTMTNSVRYRTYDTTKPDAPRPIGKDIFIQGGKGLASERSGFGDKETCEISGNPIWTAQGFVTPISDSDYERLKIQHTFKRHLERGLVKVVNRDISENHGAITKEARDMNMDGFAPMSQSRLGQTVKVSTKKLDAEQKFRL